MWNSRTGLCHPLSFFQKHVFLHSSLSFGVKMQFGFKLITRALIAAVCLQGSTQHPAAWAEITQRRKAGLNFISAGWGDPDHGPSLGLSG